MILGALIDAGVPLPEIRRALGSLALSADTISADHVMRAGTRPTKFHVAGELPPTDHPHAHDHAHAHHSHPSHHPATAPPHPPHQPATAPSHPSHQPSP